MLFRRLTASLCAISVCLAPVAASAQDDEEESLSGSSDDAGDDDDDDDDDDDRDRDRDRDDDDRDDERRRDRDRGDDDDDDDDDDRKKKGTFTSLLDPWVVFGVGFLGHVGGNFLDKPGNQNVPPLANSPRPEYPGFAGLTAGFGGMLDVRFMEFFGIEFDFIRTTDSGNADIDITNLTTGASRSFQITIEHSAWHLPLLFKGSLPGEIVNPMIFLGPEFVIPSDAVFTSDPALPASTRKSAFSESYTNFTFGMGLEFKLPIPIEQVQFRIPFQLRGSFNPGVSGERIERAQHNVSGSNLVSESYSTAFKFQAVAAFGLGVHF
jgi:hypothetical protein